MKNLLTIAVLLLSGSIYSQDQMRCHLGSCETGEGISLNSDSTIVKIGIFVDKKLNGAGYLKEKNGNYYYSNFKNDVPSGFSVFYIGEGLKQHGKIQNGMKEGEHVIMYSDLTLYTIVTYKNDKEVSRRDFTFDFNKMKEGCQGDCLNGFGIIPNGPETLLLGFFMDGIFVRGEVVNLISGSSEIYEFESKDEVKGLYSTQDYDFGTVEEFMVIDYFESKGVNKQKSSVTVNRDNFIFFVTAFDEEGQVKNQIKN